MSLKENEKRKEKKKQMGSLSFFVKNFIFVDIEFGLQIFGSCGFYDVRFDSNLYSFNVSVIEFFFFKESYQKNRKREKKIGLPCFNNKKINFNVNRLSCQEKCHWGSLTLLFYWKK